MVSSFKLSLGTGRLLMFSRRAGHIRKGKSKICGSTKRVMHNVVSTGAVLRLVGTTNLRFTLSYMTSSATKPE